MNRRNFTTCVLSAAAVGLNQSPTSAAQAGKEDVQAGCEGAVAALKGWIHALGERDFDYLEQVLASDFMFTVDPKMIGGASLISGVRDKKGFIEQDRHVFNSKIELLGLTARKFGDLVATVVFAHIDEEFRGDLGSGLPTAAQMNAAAKGKTLGYASSWRHLDGRWQCTGHHILGEVHTA